MRQRLFVYGAGGLGREVMSWINQLEMWEPAGFLDDQIKPGSLINGLPVVGDASVLESMESPNVILAVGDPALKYKLFQKAGKRANFPVLVHPRAVILDNNRVTVGKGAIISAGVVVTTNVTIGDHVLLNLNVTVGHDVVLGSYCSVMPGANIAGFVHIGDRSLLGAGCNIRNGVSIGNDCTVGMGAAVLHDVHDSNTVIGVPARPMEKKVLLPKEGK